MVYNVRCKVYDAQGTLHSVHDTMYTSQHTIHNMQYTTRRTLHYAPYTVHCTPRTVQHLAVYARCVTGISTIDRNLDSNSTDAR